MPRVKAVIWDYFNISESNVHFAVCMLCVSHGGSSAKTYNTSDLINDLKRNYPVDFKDHKEKKKVQELNEKEADGNETVITGGNRGKGKKTLGHQ